MQPILMKALSKMPHLKDLNISDNKITFLPMNTHYYLKSLETLNLNNNRIDDLYNCVDVLS